MKFKYEVVKIRAHGLPAILFAAKTYDEIQNWCDTHMSLILGNEIEIRQSSVLKKIKI
ncbi:MULTISPECIES: hypothetical protein [Ureaplasma]|uniref:Uncharacterized protein n=2 Tax=Ureaplasma TaxID=2129 RepID=A0ABT3BQ10_9BACT|nr:MULTISPECIES: hypothetical protein [Ureaplasma]MCV3728756.1 hypothetical protein [Ureaplasma miroungigenitalium]MCV3734555.1 hypothetical protein [Ureaplasma miroungigenitalium]MCV3754346.1 hypothetical protein [Ureaplasma zalophigenitalium]